MNKERRKTLHGIIDELESQKENIETLQEEEQEAYDNLPESIQASDRGDAMCENADDLSDAADSLDDIISALQEILER